MPPFVTGLALVPVILLAGPLADQETGIRYLVAAGVATIAGVVAAAWIRTTPLSSLFVMDDMAPALGVSACLFWMFMSPTLDNTPLVVVGALFFGGALEEAFRNREE